MPGLNRTGRWLIATAALTAACFAQAGPVISFTNGVGMGQTSFTKTLSDGSATATFGNFSADGGATTFFVGSSDGVLLGSGNAGSVWTVTFDATVVLSSVDISVVIRNDGFDIAGNGVSADDLLVGAGDGTHAIGPFTFLANQTYTFSTNNHCPNCGAVGFKTWEFGVEGATVPEPATPALLLAALLGASVARRRRQA
jgi:hypothetical protein